MRSSLSMFLAVCGDHTTDPYSTCDLTNAQYSTFKVSMSFQPLQVLLSKPKILLALFVMASTWEFQERWWWCCLFSRDDQLSAILPTHASLLHVWLKYRICLLYRSIVLLYHDCKFTQWTRNVRREWNLKSGATNSNLNIGNLKVKWTKI